MENPLSCVTRTMGMSKPVDALVIVNAIEVLRADEGNSITFVCDNPDFDGQPAAKVICNGDWTNWADRAFTGDTVFECLGAALAANTVWTKEQAAADPFNAQGSGPAPVEPREPGQ